jgi:hypothetical protein
MCDKGKKTLLIYGLNGNIIYSELFNMGEKKWFIPKLLMH